MKLSKNYRNGEKASLEQDHKLLEAQRIDQRTMTWSRCAEAVTATQENYSRSLSWAQASRSVD